jgi:hypothetical protein
VSAAAPRLLIERGGVDLESMLEHLTLTVRT